MDNIIKLLLLPKTVISKHFIVPLSLWCKFKLTPVIQFLIRENGQVFKHISVQCLLSKVIGYNYSLDIWVGGTC